MNFWETPIENLPQTSGLTIRRFKLLGIKIFWDLLNYFPFRYENYSLVSPIDKIQPGEKLTVKGQILDIKNEYSKKGISLQKAILYDQTGKIQLVWYNQPYLLKVIKPLTIISVAGRIKEYFSLLTMEVEEYEILDDINTPTIHTGRVVPIYPEKKGLSSKTIREKIWYLLKQKQVIEEILPQKIVNFNKLIGEDEAYRQIHFPCNLNKADLARKRLAFDEIFIIQLSSKLTKKEWEKEKVTHPFLLTKEIKNKIQQFIKNLPFSLTHAQKRCIEEILLDLQKTKPMNRLLQGDVGSGKTVVAAVASYFAYLCGFKTLFMAPTEILARQHFQNLSSLFKKVEDPKIVLYTSSEKPKPSKLKEATIVVGTHALIDKKAIFEKVGLVIIDEQQKFGVVQRAMLKKKGVNPHLLTMTATPIPRTVLLTFYGELDLSIIDEMPPNKAKVKTFFVPKNKRQAGYEWIKQQIIKNNAQVFIICPLIEESKTETMKSIKAAKKEYERLKNEVFREFKLALLHGKMKTKEKDEIMKKFANHQFDILVSTPVVEVGIDVPDATIILIEGAERFGLAQLHQLRGRVGRRNKPGYCFLFTEKEDEKIIEKLKLFAKIDNGFKLAEYDLKMRGPGEIYGTKQHGFLNLKIASLTDYDLIKKSEKAVDYFLSYFNLDQLIPLKKRLENYKISIISRD